MKASASFGVSVSLMLVGLMAGVATVSPQRAAARDHASGLRLGSDWSAHAGFYNPQWSAGDAERESIESFSIPSFGLGRRPRVGYSIDPDLAGRHTKSPSVLRLNLGQRFRVSESEFSRDSSTGCNLVRGFRWPC